MHKTDSILVFGGGILQLSIIQNCKDLNLNVVVIDPDENALGKEIADFFYPIGGQDFEGTCAIIDKHNIQGIVTASTDKPLVMMAEIADKYNFPHYSLETAQLCTDKYKMKMKFFEYGIPCADGKKIFKYEDIEVFPTIIKPVDNSGSRGVYYCHTLEDARILFEDSMTHTKKDYLLADTVIGGAEYSVESAHFNGLTHIIQFTEKITTEFPNNVELSHSSPANLPSEIKNKIEAIVVKIANAFKFEDCISHTEVKIQGDDVFVIETSPRTGGDFIASHLVPISTHVNIEQLLISIAMAQEIKLQTSKSIDAGIFYFFLKDGVISNVKNLDSIINIEGVHKFAFRLKPGDTVPRIKNSLDRYGFVVLEAASYDELQKLKNRVFQKVFDNIEFEPDDGQSS